MREGVVPAQRNNETFFKSAGMTQQENQLEWIARTIPLPSGMGAWLRTFAGRLLAQFPAAERDTVAKRVVEALRWSLCDETGQWRADYTRLRFLARLARCSQPIGHCADALPRNVKTCGHRPVFLLSYYRPAAVTGLGGQLAGPR